MIVRLDALLNEVPTPSLILDFEEIANSYQQFVTSFPGAMIFYAMKANAHPDIIQLVVNRGGGLEIASLAELEKSFSAGADGSRIICSNPIKNPVFLRRMHEAGVYAVVVDSTYEVEKVAQYMPGARVYMRLAVDNTGSVLPLDGKFGVDAELALELCDLSRELGLNPIGLSFHVGSQCLSPMNWVKAIAACGDVWRAATERGHNFHFLDIGGGYPAGSNHDASIPTTAEIGSLVMEAVENYIPPTPEMMLVLEPGRGLSGEAGWLVTTVEGKALRGSGEWLYLDAGVFNGLMEAFEGFPPVVKLLADGVEDRPLRRYTIAGPSCDSCDVVARNLEMPEAHIGERIVFFDVGAYTNEYAVAFNGFPIPRVMALNRDDIDEAQPVHEEAVLA
ncbi:MAG: type III PLP-dependent enzyme [Anaerolineae bacterium]|nr:type III PLP-dependent enzyme [Anaerolineae bacterium]